MARCWLAVTSVLVLAGCNFRVLALPIDDGNAADLATPPGPPVASGDLAAVDVVDLAMPSTPPPDLGVRDLATTPVGALMGTRDAVPPGNIDLTAEGASDWAQWGLTAPSDVNHKSGVTALVGIAATGQPLQQFGNYMPSFKWSDGTPTTKMNKTSSGVYVGGVNSAITITARADTTMRTLRVYLTNFNSTGKLVAHLSDGSAPDYTQTLSTGANQYYRVTLAYRAASANQTLTVTWTLTADSGGGSVDAMAATLF